MSGVGGTASRDRMRRSGAWDCCTIALKEGLQVQATLRGLRGRGGEGGGITHPSRHLVNLQRPPEAVIRYEAAGLPPTSSPQNCLQPPPPPCDIPSGCGSFTGPWTVTRSSLRMLRRVAAFCRPLRPVLLLVSFLVFAEPSNWRTGGCAGCCRGCFSVFAAQSTPHSGRPPRASLSFCEHVVLGLRFLYGALDSHPFFPPHVASRRCVLTAAAAGAPAGVPGDISSSVGCLGLSRVLPFAECVGSSLSARPWGWCALLCLCARRAQYLVCWGRWGVVLHCLRSGALDSHPFSPA